MKYIYIIVLLLVIYYIYCRSSYTENFDPSLVPVSSIVTLAKIANKLVSNNQITIPSDLTIVGQLTTDSTTTLNDNAIITKNGITITGPIKSTGNNTLNGPTNIKNNFVTTTLTTADLNSNSTINSTQNNGVNFNSKYTILNNSNNLTILNSTKTPILTFTPSGDVYQNSNTMPTISSNDFAARNLNINNKLIIVNNNNKSITIDDNIIQFGNGVNKVLKFQTSSSHPTTIMELNEENKSVSIPGRIICNSRDFTKKNVIPNLSGKSSGNVYTFNKTDYPNLFTRSFLIIYMTGSGTMGGNCWGNCVRGFQSWSKGFNISISSNNYQSAKQTSPTYSANSSCGGCGTSNGDGHDVSPSFKYKFLLKYGTHYDINTISLTLETTAEKNFGTSIFNLLEVC